MYSIHYELHTIHYTLYTIHYTTLHHTTPYYDTMPAEERGIPVTPVYTIDIIHLIVLIEL